IQITNITNVSFMDAKVGEGPVRRKEFLLKKFKMRGLTRYGLSPACPAHIHHIFNIFKTFPSIKPESERT
ncbi:MAG: hypothetical protein K2L03_08780, partial [Bacteroidales bacterium]|nr:hypothetical protein [Bacteroidales bacterium]